MTDDADELSGPAERRSAAALRCTLARGAGAALDLLLPPHCPACDHPVDRAGSFCAGCWARLVFLREPCCGQCGQAFASAALGGTPRRCEDCRQAPPPWGRARAALRYDRRSAGLILKLKYNDRGDLARVLAAHMARAGEDLLRGADLLVPVPLHRWRLLRRRYNQAGLLAARLGRIGGQPVGPDVLARVGLATSMRGRTSEERRAAAQDAFVVRPRRRAMLAGRKVVLVDDVLTTGATAGACARVLLAAGAASVDVLAAARAGGGEGARRRAGEERAGDEEGGVPDGTVRRSPGRANAWHEDEE